MCRCVKMAKNRSLRTFFGFFGPMCGAMETSRVHDCYIIKEGSNFCDISVHFSNIFNTHTLDINMSIYIVLLLAWTYILTCIHILLRWVSNIFSNTTFTWRQYAYACSIKVTTYTHRRKYIIFYVYYSYLTAVAFMYLPIYISFTYEWMWPLNTA